jgi:hypothetical protein
MMTRTEHALSRARPTWLATLALLAGCAGTPQPDWQLESKSALDRATAAWLTGNTRVSQVDAARARAELARTGRPELLARAELLLCAARVAALEFDDCPAYAALAPDAGAAERAYADYLAGRTVPPQDLALLPEAQRQADPAAIADPLARLVALGVRLRRGAAADAALAVDTASAQGWRRPLLAWLQIQLRQAESAGDAAQAERTRRRIALILGS